MNLFTRITATLTGTVDQIVSHIENHDAVVDAALKETRAAVAKAHVRLERVRKDGKAMRERLQEQQKQERLWEERARTIAPVDELKALECIARRNQFREQAQQTEKALARHEELERQLSENVTCMEQRLSEITQQQNLMRSRHSTAEAMRVVSRIEGASNRGIEDTFDRWEALITETEYANGAIRAQVDPLDTVFTEQETAARLKADLAALLESGKPAFEKE